ncbi:MAG: carboxymuconolactone decarboxylase family protein, partial [Paracoccaceae bacterium]|nr:carboxymuconolactone decarboxylase family protein [Paracoccaceae bacterium]
NFHVDALMRAGGTRQELSDVLAMALQMGGGPALMYAGHALACWDELEAAAAAK